MAIEIKYNIKGLIPKTTIKQFNLMKKREFFAVAGWWHARIRPIHFSVTGARKYNFRRRVSKNVKTGQPIRKYKDMISGAPLVWTGETFRKSRQRILYADSRKGIVKLPIIHVNRYRPPGWPAGQIRYEIVKVLPSEERQVAKQIERGLRDNFSRNKRNINVTTFKKDV